MKGDFEKVSIFEHEYPPTKVMWIPDLEGTHNDLIATSGEFLRIYDIKDDSKNVKLKSKLVNNKHSEYCAPLTSFDWNT